MAGKTWTSDNGDGTFTNPLFYEEFSDPDIIRVGDVFYMTGTTMHTMPGLPILQSSDLVNWELLTYAFDVLDLGPSFRLEGDEIYGQGIWAPCLRYHDGTFYIFTNINKHKTQIFTATNPAGPWSRREMQHCLHDLSVLFDDDGKVYVVWGYRNLQVAQLTEDLTDLVPGTQAEIFGEGSDIGEGVHLYKIDGKYLMTSAWFVGSMRMPAARADNIYGPWEINPSLSEWEDFGLMEGYKIEGAGIPFTPEPPFEIVPPNPAQNGRLSLHQGGVVDTPQGEWWGWSMMDYNSLGRLTSLSPVTWKDGWPYFGLPGNLGRTPRTWVKPKSATTQAPRALFERSDDFDGPGLKPIWQWNHVPVGGKWSLAERQGHLRLHALPAPDFWMARNTLTQRAVGPISMVTAQLDGSGLAGGDVAGLGLLGVPWRWIGLQREGAGWQVVVFDQQAGQAVGMGVIGPQIWLRATCNFLTEKAQFSFSSDGENFRPLGEEMIMIFQLKTFQGIRYGLFSYGAGGGYADFAGFAVDEAHPRGLMRPIPKGQTIILSRHDGARTVLSVDGVNTWLVEDAGLGRVVLRSGQQHLTVGSDGTVGLRSRVADMAAQWQWMETPYGEVILMSLATNRFLRMADDGSVAADSAGPRPDGLDGVRWDWVLG